MMRFVCLVAFLGCALASRTAWESFKLDYMRSFASLEEEQHRFWCFEGNVEEIARLNAQGASEHGINQFADICPEEFKASHHNLDLASKPVSNATLWSVTEEEAARIIPEAGVDWRTKGAVTHVKNQGQCGSCWTFSAVCAMEASHYLKHNQLVGLSEEELCQCAKSAGQGCQGGWMDKAIQWVVQNGGIDSEADYSYTSGGGRTGTCNTAKKNKYVAKFTAVKEIAHSETSMAAYVTQHGPISIGVDAQTGWQSYRGGIMKTCSGRQVDHGVAVVGFTSEYWIVKNSWGTGWGESGYIRLQKGTNQCDIKSAPCAAVSA